MIGRDIRPQILFLFMALNKGLFVSEASSDDINKTMQELRTFCQAANSHKPLSAEWFMHESAEIALRVIKAYQQNHDDKSLQKDIDTISKRLTKHTATSAIYNTLSQANLELTAYDSTTLFELYCIYINKQSSLALFNYQAMSPYLSDDVNYRLREAVHYYLSNKLSVTEVAALLPADEQNHFYKLMSYVKLDVKLQYFVGVVKQKNRHFQQKYQVLREIFALELFRDEPVEQREISFGDNQKLVYFPNLDSSYAYVTENGKDVSLIEKLEEYTFEDFNKIDNATYDRSARVRFFSALKNLPHNIREEICNDRLYKINARINLVNIAQRNLIVALLKDKNNFEKLFTAEELELHWNKKETVEFAKKVTDVLGKEKAKEFFQKHYDKGNFNRKMTIHAMTDGQMPLPPFDAGMLEDMKLPQIRALYQTYGVELIRGEKGRENFQKFIYATYRKGSPADTELFIHHFVELNDPESYFDICINALYFYNLEETDISVYLALKSAMDKCASKIDLNNCSSAAKSHGYQLFRAAFIDASNKKNQALLDKTFPSRDRAFKDSDNLARATNYYNLVTPFLNRFHEVKSSTIVGKTKELEAKLSLLTSSYNELIGLIPGQTQRSVMLDSAFPFRHKLLEQIKGCVTKLLFNMANAYIYEGKFYEALELSASPEAKKFGVNFDQPHLAGQDVSIGNFELVIKNYQHITFIAMGPTTNLEKFYDAFNKLPKEQRIDALKIIKRLQPEKTVAEFFSKNLPTLDAQTPAYLEALHKVGIALPATLAKPETFSAVINAANKSQHAFLLEYFVSKLPSCDSKELVAWLPSISAIPNSEKTVIAILNHLAENDKEGISYNHLMECILINYDRIFENESHIDQAVEALYRLRQNQQTATDKSELSSILKTSLIFDAIEHQITTKEKTEREVHREFLKGHNTQATLIENYLKTLSKASTVTDQAEEFISFSNKLNSADAFWSGLKFTQEDAAKTKENLAHGFALRAINRFCDCLKMIDRCDNLTEAMKFYDRFKSDPILSMLPKCHAAESADWAFWDTKTKIKPQLEAADKVLQIISCKTFTFKEIYDLLVSLPDKPRLYVLKEMKRVLGAERCNQFFATAVTSPKFNLPKLLQSLSEAEISLPDYLRQPSALKALLEISSCPTRIVADLYTSTLGQTWNTPSLIQEALYLIPALYKDKTMLEKIILADSSNDFFFNLAETLYTATYGEYPQSFDALTHALITGYKKLKADPNSKRQDISAFLSAKSLLTDALIYAFDQCKSDEELKSHAKNYLHRTNDAQLVKYYLDSLTVSLNEDVNFALAAKLESAFDWYYARTKSLAPTKEAEAILVELRATYKSLLFAQKDALIAEGKYSAAKEILEAAQKKDIIKTHREEAGFLRPQNYIMNPQAARDIDSQIKKINEILNPSAGFFGFLSSKPQYEKIPAHLLETQTTVVTMPEAPQQAVAQTNPASVSSPSNAVARSIPLPEPTAGWYGLFAKQNPIRDTMRAFFNKFTTGSLMKAISHYDKDLDGKINQNSGVISLILAACAATTFMSSDRVTYIKYLKNYSSYDPEANQLALFLHELCTSKEEEFALANLEKEEGNKHPIDLILLAMEICNAEAAPASFHFGTEIPFDNLLGAVRTAVESMFTDSGMDATEAAIKVTELKESAAKDMEARNEKAKLAIEEFQAKRVVPQAKPVTPQAKRVAPQAKHGMFKAKPEKAQVKLVKSEVELEAELAEFEKELVELEAKPKPIKRTALLN